MSGIFLSYRRDDTMGYVYALRERLAARFAITPIFMDIDSIEPSLDFAGAIENSVASCNVVLALIGKRWLQPQKLQDPTDFVRLEIQAALERGIRVIPVLLDGMQMPSPEELPEVLVPLSRRQACEISSRHFSEDFDFLCELLGKILDEQINLTSTLPSQRTAQALKLSDRSETGRERTLRRTTILAWVIVGMQSLLTTPILFYSYNYKAYRLSAVLFTASTLLLFLSLAFKIWKRPLAGKTLQVAGIWQIASIIGIFGTFSLSRTLSSDLYSFAAIFAISALAFFFLAYRHRQTRTPREEANKLLSEVPPKS